MADLIAINKADGDNIRAAKRARAEYQNALHLFPANESGWIPQVTTCSSMEGSGLDEIWELIEKHDRQLKGNGFFEQNRKSQNGQWMKERIGTMLESAFYKLPAVEAEYPDLLEKVKAGEIPALNAAHQLLKYFFQ